MSKVKITVINRYLPCIIEEFVTSVDISDLEEVEMAAAECCGVYLELYDHLICALTPDIERAEVVDACEYIIEEVMDNELELF